MGNELVLEAFGTHDDTNLEEIRIQFRESCCRCLNRWSAKPLELEGRHSHTRVQSYSVTSLRQFGELTMSQSYRNSANLYALMFLYVLRKFLAIDTCTGNQMHFCCGILCFSGPISLKIHIIAVIRVQWRASDTVRVCNYGSIFFFFGRRCS